MVNNHHNSSPNSPEEKDRIKSRILETIKKEFFGIATTNEISDVLEVSWNTAEKYMLELAIDRKIERMKKKGVNLWILRKGGAR